MRGVIHTNLPTAYINSNTCSIVKLYPLGIKWGGRCVVRIWINLIQNNCRCWLRCIWIGKGKRQCRRRSEAALSLGEILLPGFGDDSDGAVCNGALYAYRVFSRELVLCRRKRNAAACC